uniref:G-protein coupled receptors family 1 profile domain-containing protein n=1 Tax=Mola mola TaxID=94237 RepID=A0A3Q4BXV1_MOLML
HRSTMAKVLHLPGQTPTTHTHLQPRLFPTVDVPDHAHYIIDFLISLRQSSVFFVASLHHRWVFGELACELYAFCGALFGISSMMTLTAIAAAAGPARRAESWPGVGGAGGGVAVLTGLECRAGQEVEELNCGEANKAYEGLRSEWRLAKVALAVIVLVIVSWSPYSAVALTATAGCAHLLTPYMNSVPTVIAKASALHNPIIFAIMHPKYRAAIALCCICRRRTFAHLSAPPALCHRSKDKTSRRQRSEGDLDSCQPITPECHLCLDHLVTWFCCHGNNSSFVTRSSS